MALAGVIVGFPTIWDGLDLWAQWALVILICVAVVICLRPVILEALDSKFSMIVAVVGGALLAYAFVKWIDVGDKADNLQAAFAHAQAAAANS
jgi:hypothetical protein